MSEYPEEYPGKGRGAFFARLSGEEWFILDRRDIATDITTDDWEVVVTDYGRMRRIVDALNEEAEFGREGAVHKYAVPAAALMDPPTGAEPPTPEGLAHKVARWDDAAAEVVLLRAALRDLRREVIELGYRVRAIETPF